jgi:hypothetical protein
MIVKASLLRKRSSAPRAITHLLLRFLPAGAALGSGGSSRWREGGKCGPDVLVVVFFIGRAMAYGSSRIRYDGDGCICIEVVVALRLLPHDTFNRNTKGFLNMLDIEIKKGSF